MATEVEFADYVRGVRASGPAVAVLDARLEKAQPLDITAAEKKALKLVHQRAAEVASVQAARDRLAPGRLRPVLLEFANGWAGVYDGLSAKARVPKHISDVGQRAEHVQSSLFPDGVSFAQADAETAWSEGSRRLQRMDDEDLDQELTVLVGKELLAAARAGTDALGAAIGTNDGATEAPSSSALQEAIARFGKAVGNYGRVLAASCDEDDEASVERFLKAVTPMDMHRAAMRSSASDNTGDTTTTAPVVTPPAHATSNGSTPAHTATSSGSTPSPAATSNGSTPSSAATSNGSTPAPTATSSGSMPAPTATSNGNVPAASTSNGSVPAPAANGTSNGEIVAPLNGSNVAAA